MREKRCLQLARAALMVAAFCATAASLAACDPPPADQILDPQPAAPFGVEKAAAPRAGIPADGVIVVRFTQDVEARSIGTRSVRLARADGRRPVRVRATASGRELHLTALPGRTLPVGETLSLRLEGAPSPRAVRSTGGEPLPAPYLTTFRVSPTRGDFTGPRLVDSLPSDGASDVAPGAAVELHFSEPLARGAVASGDAVTLRVDGQSVAARLEISGDRATIVVRPETPLAPDRAVDVEIHPSLLDLAGNPLDPASRRRLSFRTRATSLHELSEDFVDASAADLRATSCGWDDPESPGVLVARNGSVLVAPGAGEPQLVIPEATSLHFQLLVPATETPRGLASALRLEFANAPEGAQLRSGIVEAGPTSLEQREPSFVANRAASELHVLARVDDAIDVETADGSRPFVDIAFEEPLRLEPGHAVLLDVRLELTPGTRLAAWFDEGIVALVEGRSDLAPAAALLVSTAVPQARSLWYDSGATFPGWQHGSVIPENAHVVPEFQSAPANRAGQPDISLASPWEADLARLPPYRFVRFRLRFDGMPDLGAGVRIDRIVLPYER